MLTREEAIRYLSFSTCCHDKNVRICSNCCDDIISLLIKQQPEPIYPSENWINPTIDEIKELSKHGTHCKHATSICEGCYRHAVAYWMTEATKINLKQPEQPRRKPIHTFVTVINYDKETRKYHLSITQTCNDGSVFISEVEGDSVGYDIRKLPPIPQDDEHA